MTESILYTLQVGIVFFTPFFFGWVLLRKILRENDFILLVSASLFIGLAVLMALLNEFRFYIEMGEAVWLTYKILIALTVIILFIKPGNPEKGNLSGIPNVWYKKWLLPFTAVFLACYFGIPAFQGVLNDSWWFHYPAAVQIATVEIFPLPRPFQPDSMLYYHYGPDMLASVWSYLLDIPVQKAFALNIVLFVPTTFLLAFALIRRASGNYWAAFFAGFFLLLAGNLRFLFLFAGGGLDMANLVTSLNSQSVEGLLEMTFTPSHLVGMPFTLVTLYLFEKFRSSRSIVQGCVFGIFLGITTMVSEWYFVLVAAGCVILIFIEGYKRPVKERQPIRFAIPFVLAFFIMIFNNSYVAGYFAPFWLKQESSFHVIEKRIEAFRIKEFKEAIAALEDLNISNIMQQYSSRVHIPNLLPISLNISHFGYVPSWENAGSTHESWVRIFGLKVLSELTPVIVLGIPLGFLAWKRRREKLFLLLTIMAIMGLFPPIFLKWGYRSVDFLRFFTASFAFCALLIGWYVGELLSSKDRKKQFAGILVAGVCLINPCLLGVAGLMPGTVDTVLKVSESAASLREVVSNNEHSNKGAELIHEELARQAGDFLYDKTGGRERIIVMVPKELLPPKEVFPSWMKLATFLRLPIPVGVHYSKTLYTPLYEDIVTGLSAEGFAGLDAKWVYLSSKYADQISEKVLNGLDDVKRFIPYATFAKDGQWVKIYRVIS